ncbi:hypothetical protein JCM11641_001546 [Rhodosporidiobolus odoratus]
MLAARCSKHAIARPRLQPEVSAALAQLPTFLVPSFAAVVDQDSARLAGQTEQRQAGKGLGQSAPSSRRAPAPPSFRSPSQNLRPPPATSPVPMYARSSSSSARIRSDEHEESVGDMTKEERRAASRRLRHLRKQQTRPKTSPPPSASSASRSSASPSQNLPPFPSDHSFGPILAYFDTLPRYLSLSDLLAMRSNLVASGHLTTVALVNRLVSRFLLAKHDAPALRFLREAVRAMRALDSHTKPGKEKLVGMYEKVIRQLTARGGTAWSFVVQVTQTALTEDLVSGLVLRARMRALYEHNRHVDTLATFALFAEHGIEPTGNDYDEAILAHLLNFELNEAQELMAEKAEKGHPTTTRTVLALLEGMAPFGGNRVMEQKVLTQADGKTLRQGLAIRQDPKVLNRLLSVRAARGNLGDALAVLDYFDFRGWPPHLVAQIKDLKPALPLSDVPSPRTVPTRAPQSAPTPHFRPPPDASTLVTLVGLLLREQRPDLAVSLLTTGHRLDFPFNPHIATSIVTTLLALHDLPSAEAFVSALPYGQANFSGLLYPALRPPTFLYEALFSGILRYRGLAGANDAFASLSEQKQISLPVTEGMSLALVNYLSLEAKKKPEMSADLLVKANKMTSGRVRPTSEHLTSLLRAAWQNERAKKPDLSIEDEFPLPHPDDLPPPPHATPSRPPPTPTPAPLPPLLPKEAELLSHTPSSRIASQPSSLDRVRESLTSRHVKPSREATRHILRNDHLLRYIPQKWAYLQSQVLDLGVRPTVRHLAVLIRAYLRLGDSKGAHLALDYALDELGMEPHVASYSTLIAGLARLGDHAGALQAYSEMQTRKVEPDRTLFAALAMSCARKRDVGAVQRVLEEVRKYARAQAPHPQLLALAQAQNLRGRGGNAALGAGVPATLLTPYDPLLDPIFVAILYRTLNAAGRLREAQELVTESMNKGMVPDQTLLASLRRTDGWLRRKQNNAAGRTLSSPGYASPSSSPTSPRTEPLPAAKTTEIGTGSARLGSVGAKLSLSQLDDLVSLTHDNLERVLKAVRGMEHGVSWNQMKRLQAYWEDAEIGLKEGREDTIFETAEEESLDAELRRIEESERERERDRTGSEPEAEQENQS